MFYLKALACATVALVPAAVLATPVIGDQKSPTPPTLNSVNPYAGKTAFANKGYAKKLEATIKYFNQKLDFINAARTRTVQRTPTFSWISSSGDVCHFA